MDDSQSTPENTIYCSACGHSNLSWRSVCEKCRAQLATPNKTYVPTRWERPGCVTAYAILLWGSAALAGIGGPISALILASEKEDSVVLALFLAAVAIGAAALNVAIGWGLWHLKNWARILVIVFQSLGVASSLASLCLTLALASGEVEPTRLCSTIVGLAINGYIIYWFASHSEYFN
jgi:hypothetical protein